MLPIGYRHFRRSELPSARAPSGRIPHEAKARLRPPPTHRGTPCRRAAVPRADPVGASGYHREVTTFYDIDRANARIPEVRDVLEHLRDQRSELIGLRDRLAELGPDAAAADGPSIVDEALRGGAFSGGVFDRGALGGVPHSPRVITARMQAVIDQMQAGVSRLDAWSIQLRSIETGLIDFPALANGRQVWLCWQLGEDEISFWHELLTGYASRRPLIELT